MAAGLDPRLAPEDLRGCLEVLADRGTLLVSELGGLLQEVGRNRNEVAPGLLEALGTGSTTELRWSAGLGRHST